MAPWTSLALLSALAVSTLSSPRPDESAYKIPHVGTGRRSQYYVQHADGTFKYGYDTGEGAFEGARSSRVGQVDGNFGYRDPEGNNIHLQYVADEGGFQPKGAHLPVPHPDFALAHAEARARPSFTDPLADPNADASYGFQFAGEGQTRSEQSDSDGNVRGSYTYTDEEGRTRTYTYTAELIRSESADANLNVDGKFSFVADDGVRRSVTYEAGSDTGFLARGDHLPRAPQSHSGSQTSSSAFSSSQTPYRSPSASLPSSVSSTPTFSRSPSAPRLPGFTSSQTQYSSPSSRPSARPYTGQFEPANTRSQQSPDGSYSFAYETSSHSRAESGDRDNNVVGNFDFVADDGQRRAIEYEAGSRTGFIAKGDHIPVGPAVPGAPSGQPTGRIVPVQEVPFVDPLADSNADASYNFAFDSEQYSRSESADADGNVRGTYTVVDDDGTRRTHRFRAGEGIGFETEEVSTSRGPPPSRSPSSATFRSPAAPGTAVSSSTSFTAQPQGSFPSPSTRTASTRSSSSSFSPSATGTRPDASNFQLRQYDASENRGKYGYVLTFDN
ncbi:uncharacterized protein LOC121860447 [Homarus americanus]|uniref:uncharacterized protein LOC121860447 n=1 Tax=Homarus americanus TaxID=6706 RepID=UPI001C44FC71|nr:uncharacterized protein LOC121860447 [Homarus americanus]